MGRDIESISWASFFDTGPELRKPGRHRGGNMFGSPKTAAAGKHAKAVKAAKVKAAKAAKAKARGKK